MTARPAPRGFSLMELAVALGVSAIVIAGALTILIGQQRTFKGSSGDRAVQEAGRVALERLTSELRLAGYGLDPGMAFDFGAAASPQSTAILEPGVGTVPFGGYLCADPVTCRDRVDGPDELVFHYRNPIFGKLVQTAAHPITETELWLQGPLNAPILPGQILQVVCYGEPLTWAYVTVAKRADATADPEFPVQLAAPTGGTTEFPMQNAFFAMDGCFLGEVRAFKIERRRYFIDTFTEQGARVPWGTAGARSYLMVDEGLRNDAGPVHSVVAQDVEDLQLAYVFPLAPSPTQVRGDAEGVALQDDAAGIDLAPTTIPSIPSYFVPSRDVSRATGHPSNMRAVRVAVVVQPPGDDAAVNDPALPRLLNRAEVVRAANRRRSVFQTTVAIPNMESRGPTYPTYGKAGVAIDQPLNHGGG